MKTMPWRPEACPRLRVRRQRQAWGELPQHVNDDVVILEHSYTRVATERRGYLLHASEHELTRARTRQNPERFPNEAPIENRQCRTDIVVGKIS